jgi:hypothetical protein
MIISITCAAVISRLRVSAEAGGRYRFSFGSIASLGGAAMLMCHVAVGSKIRRRYCRYDIATAAKRIQMA